MNRHKGLAPGKGLKRTPLRRKATLAAPTGWPAGTSKPAGRQRASLAPCGKPYRTKEAALGSKKGLTGAYLPIPCPAHPGEWHLVGKRALDRRVEKALAAAGRPRKDTGPSRKVRLAVLERDGWACVRCGHSITGCAYSIHHRDDRGMGGTSSPAFNCPEMLLTLCGTGTTGCHGVVGCKKAEDNAKGYWLKTGQDPLLTPVMVFSEHGSGVTAWPARDAHWVFGAPEGAAA